MNERAIDVLKAVHLPMRMASRPHPLTHPLKMSLSSHPDLYPYNPSLAFGVLGCVAFGLVGVSHTVRLVRYPATRAIHALLLVCIVSDTVSIVAGAQ